MAYIVRNEYGSVVVNDRVLIKMIVEELLKFDDAIILCNRKSKIIKDKPTLFIDSDYYDAVEYLDTIKANEIRIYMVKPQSVQLNDIIYDIYSRINDIFDGLRVARPQHINIYIKGEMTDEGLIKNETEVQHFNG